MVIAIYIACIGMAALIFAIVWLLDQFMQSHSEYFIVAPRYRRRK